MTNTSSIDLSVVIGFKNWGLNRLELAIRSIRESFGSIKGEVVVSDYGSTEFAETKALVEGLGCKYIYTETDGTWSRSRALNIGFSISEGAVLACTDADMIFTPGTFQRIFEVVSSNPASTVLLECRDLPKEWTDVEVREKGAQWLLFDEISGLRGRWGMGGMVAVHREVVSKVRGLDERMHTYGCEDIDFGERTQRAGNRILWLDEPGIRMFHMWHEPSGPAAEANPNDLKIIDANRYILYNDKSFIRNTTSWLCAEDPGKPLVSVAIATRNRAHLIENSIQSVLAQTVQDFEIIIIDDGSTDNTRDIVLGISDERLRYFRQDGLGIAAARNLATKNARGRYIAVLDDDDIMLPWRLEAQLKSITNGIQGSYGAFVNFDNESGDLTIFNEKNASVTTAFERGGAPGHSTWMIDAAVMRMLPYDETIVSGEDNNLFLRMLRSGFRIVHCGEIVSLRRLHGHQITQNDGNSHVRFAGLNRYFFRFNTASHNVPKIEELGRKMPWVSVRGGKDFENLVRPYLPDHLVRRTVVLDEEISESQLAQIREAAPEVVGVTRFRQTEIISRTIALPHITWSQLHVFAKLGVKHSVKILETESLENKKSLNIVDHEINSFIEESLGSKKNKEQIKLLVIADRLLSSDAFESTSDFDLQRIVYGDQTIHIYASTCDSFSMAIGKAKLLQSLEEVVRVDVFLNDAKSRLLTKVTGK